MDTDYLLGLEEQYYQEGYDEGAQEKARHNFTEGKQYGLQVGFQRFLILGQIQGLIDVIEACGTPGASISKNIESVRGFLADLKMDNDDANVAEYEAKIIKIRNKLRTVLLLLQRQTENKKKDPLTLDNVEKVSMIIAGQLKGYVDNEENDVEVRDQMQDW